MLSFILEKLSFFLLDCLGNLARKVRDAALNVSHKNFVERLGQKGNSEVFAIT
jgi:hypothetical protein